MPTATNAASQALPRGLRIRRDRRWPAWLGVVAVVGAGVAAGLVVSGTPPAAALGTVAVLIAVGAAVYRLALGLAVLAFTYPFDLTTKLGPLKLTTSGLLMGILVVTWLVRQTGADRPDWIHTRLDRPVLLFAGATALSLLGFGGYLDDQLVGLAKAAGGFLMFFIATQSLRERRDIRMVVCAVVATGLVQAVWLTFQVLTGAQVISEESRATGTVIDANLFAGYLVLVIPLAIAAGLAIGWRVGVIITAAAAFTFSVAMVATLSRSGWLGALTSVILLLLLLPSHRRRLAAMTGVILIALLIVGTAGPVADRLGPHSEGPLEIFISRWNVWTSAVAIVVNHPIFGVGVANFQNYYLQYDPQDPGLNHAHNLLLNTAAERGMVGLVAFSYQLVVLFGILLKQWRSAGARSELLMAAALLAAFGGYFVHSLFEVSYYDYKVLLLFWLLIGGAAAGARFESDGVPRDVDVTNAKTYRPELQS